MRKEKKINWKKSLMSTLLTVGVLSGALLMDTLSVSAAELTKQTFDSARYADEYPDVKNAFGYDHDALWKHYSELGRSEGRNAYATDGAAAAGAQGVVLTRANFDSARYADEYPDLKNAFGYDHDALWQHYVNSGKAEGRNAYVVGDGSFSASAPRSAYINGVTPIGQYPELPTGCEVTALTMALNYAGYSVDKATLANHYLPKTPVGSKSSANPYTSFIGNPTSRGSYGCYAPAIVTCARNFGAQATDLSNSDFNTILSYVGSGQPVIIWGTMNMVPTEKGKYVYTRPDGVKENWKSHEHCLLMIGYDLDANTATFADPQKGRVVNYDLSVFLTRWAEQGKQAAIAY